MTEAATTRARPPLAQAALLLALFIGLPASLLSTAPLTVAASWLCLVFIIKLLWTQDEPPILLLPALFQWSEVATIPLSTIWKQVPLNQLSDNNADLEPSAMFGLAAVAFLAVGLRLGSGRSRRAAFAKRIREEAMTWRYRDVALAAFTTLGLSCTSSVPLGLCGARSRTLQSDKQH